MRSIAGVLLMLGCGLPPLDPRPETSDGGNDAAQNDVLPDGAGGDLTGDAAACPGTSSAWDCINGCATGHVVVMRVCEQGAWVCPPSTVPLASCAGTGDCDRGQEPVCVTMGAVRVYPSCQNGTWICPGGTVMSPGRGGSGGGQEPDGATAESGP